MTFVVEDANGRELAVGDDLEVVRQAVRPQLRARLAAATAGLEKSGLTAWTIGKLPRTVALRGMDRLMRAYPALVDEGATVGVRVLDTPEAQAESMRAGTRRLLLLVSPSPLKYVRDRLGPAASLSFAAAPEGTMDDIVAAAVDALAAEAGGPAWDEAAFASLRDHVAGNLAERALVVAAHVVKILLAAREVERLLEPMNAVPLQPARADVRRQLRRLVHPGFVSASGADRLADVERYLRAAARRLERLPDAVAIDRDRMANVHALEQEYAAALQAAPRGRPLPDGLREVPWLLEELRVNQFAQAVGTRGQVSTKRIRRVLAAR